MTCCNLLQNINRLSTQLYWPISFRNWYLQQTEIKKKLNSFFHSVVRYKKIGCFKKTIGCFSGAIKLYRPGHRSWWRAWHVTVWGVISRTRWQVRNEWFRSEHSRRFMELGFCSEHGQLSPGLRVIDVLDNGRSGGLTSPRGAHRRISQ